MRASRAYVNNLALRPPLGAAAEPLKETMRRLHIEAEEIALMDLKGTELVVLSACETGLGDVQAGEGVFGLRRAFLYAGADTLVISLFKVPDTQTRELMQAFYQGLKAGKGKLVALHEARQAVIQARRQKYGGAHPLFWAGFVLVGVPD